MTDQTQLPSGDTGTWLSVLFKCLFFLFFFFIFLKTGFALYSLLPATHCVYQASWVLQRSVCLCLRELELQVCSTILSLTCV